VLTGTQLLMFWRNTNHLPVTWCNTLEDFTLPHH